MRPYRIVVLSPTFDEHLRLRQSVEDFSVQKLVAELSVEGLVVSVLPGAAWFDEQGSDPDPSEPGPDGFGRELRAVVGAYVIRRPPVREQIGQVMENVVGPKPPGHQDRQALPAVLINDGEHPEHLAIMRASLDEVVSPDVVLPTRTQTNARPIIEP